MEILDKIDNILEEDVVKSSRGGLVAIMISIALLIGGGMPVDNAVETVHRDLKVSGLDIKKLKKQYLNAVKS